jgi:hypothetical protein
LTVTQTCGCARAAAVVITRPAHAAKPHKPKRPIIDSLAKPLGVPLAGTISRTTAEWRRQTQSAGAAK